MSKSFVKTLYLFLFLMAIFISYLCVSAEFESVKKFYPNLTMWDYLMVGDKIRIIPNGE